MFYGVDANRGQLLYFVYWGRDGGREGGGRGVGGAEGGTNGRAGCRRGEGGGGVETGRGARCRQENTRTEEIGLHDRMLREAGRTA